MMRTAKGAETMMTMETTQDVPNPDADRRHKYDPQYYDVWPKGTRFRIVGNCEHVDGIEFTHVPGRSAHTRYSWMPANSDGGRAILAVSTPVAESFREFARRHAMDRWAIEAFEIIEEMGMMSRAEMVKIKEMVHAKWDAAEAAEGR